MIDDAMGVRVLWIFVFSAFAFRLASLVRSKINEKRLRAAGAIEIGAGNSAALTMAHIIVYLAAVTEGVLRGMRWDVTAIAGIMVYVFGGIALVWVVLCLGRLWTVKVLLAPNHELVRNILFRTFRHPNYYLAIIPELIGLIMAMHAVATLVLLGPVYGVILAIRIQLEEKAMRDRFPEY